MSPRPDVSVERRSQILDTAAVVFAQRGLYQARIEDIAREAGLSKGTIYWYFQSKEEIIFALMQRVFDNALADIQTLLPDDISVRERLLQLSRLIIDDVTQMLEQGILALFYEFYALVSHQENVRQFFQTYFRTYRTALIPLVEQGIERGEFRPIDPFPVVVSFIALHEGLILLSITDPQEIRLAEQAKAAVHVLLDGLQPRSQG